MDDATGAIYSAFLVEEESTTFRARKEVLTEIDRLHRDQNLHARGGNNMTPPSARDRSYSWLQESEQNDKWIVRLKVAIFAAHQKRS